MTAGLAKHRRLSLIVVVVVGFVVYVLASNYLRDDRVLPKTSNGVTHWDMTNDMARPIDPFWFVVIGGISVWGGIIWICRRK